MRHITVALCACLIAVPAFAKPARVSTATTVSKPASATQAGKQRTRSSRRGNALGGINPLVGSGDY